MCKAPEHWPGEGGGEEQLVAIREESRTSWGGEGADASGRARSSARPHPRVRLKSGNDAVRFESGQQQVDEPQRAEEHRGGVLKIVFKVYFLRLCPIDCADQRSIQ